MANSSTKAALDRWRRLAFDASGAMSERRRQNDARGSTGGQVLGRTVQWLAVSALALALLYLVYLIYLRGQPLWALAALALFAVGFYVFLVKRAYIYRYLFPGLAGMAIFVVFPLLYTIQISFTNYSSSNLLSYPLAKRYLLDERIASEGDGLRFTLHQDGKAYRLVFQTQHEGEEQQDSVRQADSSQQTLVTPPIVLLGGRQTEIKAVPIEHGGFVLNEPLPISQVIAARDALSRLKVHLPDGRVLSYAGLRDFAVQRPVHEEGPDGTLIVQQTGEKLIPNFSTGFFENQAGEKIRPGFTVSLGLRNYSRILTDPEFQGPFVQIFLWTVVFAFLSVVFTLFVGCTLAVVLNWEALKYRTIYRTLLFLPYAVPSFISILVFKGLFNGHFGEINLILSSLFGIKPQWFADPFLAKVMILIVNTWLGYPYMMVLCTGLIKSIPADLYEASAIAGAGPLTNFSRITAPLIVQPLMPLLVASFAFNFNNFVLISLLTRGLPDFLNTRVPAGTTDILVSYTYRIAFQDSGQDFGLAAAISTVIFIMVALLSMLNLKLTRVNKQAAR